MPDYKRTFEKCYYNEGQIYKEAFENVHGELGSVLGDVTTTYFSHYQIKFPEGYEADYLEIAKKTQNGKIKYKVYKPSCELFDYCETTPKAGCDDLSSYNLPPIAGVWIGSGRYTDNSEFDIFFTCLDSTELKMVSDHFNLTFPLATDNDFDSNPEWDSFSAKSWITTMNPEVADDMATYKLCAIKYVNNVPTMVKAYQSSINPIYEY